MRTERTGILVLTIALAALFSGCLYAGQSAGPTPSATALQSPTPSVTPVPSATPESPVPYLYVDYVESGGLAGSYRKEISVSQYGVVYVNDNGHAFAKSLSSAELSAFAKSLNSSGIFSAVSSNLTTCPDAYDESLIVEIANLKTKFEKGGYCPGSSLPFERAAAIVRALAT